MRTIRASELGTYLYCARAWGYARKGYPSANEDRMQAGIAYHEEHGREVFTIRLLKLAGWALLLLALTALAAWWAWQFTGG